MTTSRLGTNRADTPNRGALAGKTASMKKRLGGWVAALLGVAVFVLLLWKGPWWADAGHLGPGLTPGRAAVITGFRTVIIAVGAGVVASLGLYYTDRSFRHTRELFEHTREKDREQAELTREGQVTDRYATAIGLLAAENLTRQLGGIYALERIMRDSPKDSATVVEVLAAFIREHAPLPTANEPWAVGDGATPSEHVQAAATVLGRRLEREESFALNLQRTNLCGADLSYAHLKGARLGEAYLESAQLLKAHLEGADLFNAQLARANLVQAHLEGADLLGAHLVGARLLGAHLVGARLVGAHLENAILISAHLEDADLMNANLEGAFLTGAGMATAKLSIEQLLGARSFRNAVLPDAIARDPRVQARLAED
ncbi:pentapeptide repeat-containing protein [Streptomyces sp. NPDC050738]|uniref:pentapeptide repeat-containing protein n=1 Tax=Streptomyces sp. NPDC050738 TaxID=3154744 RepID=UPI0034392EF2